MTRWAKRGWWNGKCDWHRPASLKLVIGEAVIVTVLIDVSTLDVGQVELQ